MFPDHARLLRKLAPGSSRDDKDELVNTMKMESSYWNMCHEFWVGAEIVLSNCISQIVREISGTGISWLPFVVNKHATFITRQIYF